MANSTSSDSSASSPAIGSPEISSRFVRCRGSMASTRPGIGRPWSGMTTKSSRKNSGRRCARGRASKPIRSYSASGSRLRKADRSCRPISSSTRTPSSSTKYSAIVDACIARDWMMASPRATLEQTRPASRTTGRILRTINDPLCRKRTGIMAHRVRIDGGPPRPRARRRASAPAVTAASGTP